MCRNLYIRKLLQIFLLSGSLPDWELSCLLFPPFVLKCNVLGLVLVLVGVRPLCSTQSPLDRVATRTSTRPPPCPTSAPCPYRTGNAHYPIRSSTFIRHRCFGNKSYPLKNSSLSCSGYQSPFDTTATNL